MDLLIQVLIGAVVFCILAYALYWVCTKFFPNFPPALWICGVILIIVLLVIVSRLTGGTVGWWPSHR